MLSIFPFPIRVLETGAPIFSANSTNSLDASAAIIPPPAYINGRLEFFIKSKTLFKASSFIYLIFFSVGIGGSFSYYALFAVTSLGISIKTGPGLPDCAI